MPTTDNDLLRAGEQIAVAEQRLNAAKAALSAAEVERDAVAARIRKLDAVRAEIVARRQRGETRGDDGAVLELAAADREGLAAILAEREAAVAAAQAPAQTAQRALESARFTFVRLEAAMAEDALRERLEHLAGLMAQAIDELREERGKLGGGKLPWAPSRALMDRLVPLDLGRAW